MFPAFLNLEGRRVVLVGGGPVAAGKLESLLSAGARVTVVAPDIHPEIERADVTLVRREFDDRDLDGAWWVVAAAPPEVNRRVLAAAEARRVFVNAVDDPPNATAYAGGVVRRDGVTIAISTDGRAPALAGLLREALDAWLPADLDDWMAAADEARRAWREQRRADGAAPPAAARDAECRYVYKSQIPNPKTEPRHVSLVGAGPGDPELWTRFARSGISRRRTSCCTMRSSTSRRCGGSRARSASAWASGRGATACRRRRSTGS